MTPETRSIAEKTRLHCPCGEFLHAEDEENLVEVARSHLAAEHPHLVAEYNREDILWMAF